MTKLEQLEARLKAAQDMEKKIRREASKERRKQAREQADREYRAKVSEALRLVEVSKRHTIRDSNQQLVYLYDYLRQLAARESQQDAGDN